MIRYVTDTDIPFLKSIWRLSFPTDTDEFIAFYFNRIFPSGETMVLIQDNLPVASMQIIPYRMKLGEHVVKAGYISGAMTHPEYRKKGFMEQLIQQSFVEMKSKGMAVSFLIPQEEWLFDFYAVYGFKKAFPRFYNQQKVISSIIPSIRSYPLPNNVDMSFLYTSLLSRKKNVVLKSESQAKYIFEDALSEGIQIFVNAGGICFFSRENNQVIVKEILAKDEIHYQSLLFSIASHYQTGEIYICRYESDTWAKYHGMLKILDESITLPPDIYMSMMLD